MVALRRGALEASARFRVAVAAGNSAATAGTAGAAGSGGTVTPPGVRSGPSAVR